MAEELRELSVDETLRMTAGNTPDADAVVTENLRWSWRELDARAAEAAGRLLTAGFRRGQVVGFMADTAPDAVALLLGMMRIGLTPVLLSPALNREQLGFELSFTEAEAVILLRSPEPGQIPEGVRALQYSGLPQGSPEAQAFEKTDIRRSGAVLFISGTSSRPKAVFLSQFQLLNNALVHKEFLKITPADRVTAALPIEHILGLVITILMPLVSGAAICICADRHTATVLETIRRERCTLLCGVPAMFHTIVTRLENVQADVSSLRIGLTGGSACSRELFEQIETRLGIMLVSTLGQTETTGGFTRWDPCETTEERRTTVGVPGKHMEVEIRDPEGKKLPPETDGEICVRGYLVSGGYLKNPEATRRLIDPDGWLHTGDVGQMDARGVIRVTGRIKDIIIRCGENISAVQVAETIESCPGVRECRVIGIPDEHRGEELCACVIADGPVTEDEIRSFTAGRLEPFKVPRYVFFFNDFVRSNIGKPIVGELKKDVLGRLESLQGK